MSRRWLGRCSAEPTIGMDFGCAVYTAAHGGLLGTQVELLLVWKGGAGVGCALGNMGEFSAAAPETLLAAATAAIPTIPMQQSGKAGLSTACVSCGGGDGELTVKALYGTGLCKFVVRGPADSGGSGLGVGGRYTKASGRAAFLELAGPNSWVGEVQNTVNRPLVLKAAGTTGGPMELPPNDMVPAGKSGFFSAAAGCRAGYLLYTVEGIGRTELLLLWRPGSGVSCRAGWFSDLVTNKKTSKPVASRADFLPFGPFVLNCGSFQGAEEFVRMLEHPAHLGRYTATVARHFEVDSLRLFASFGSRPALFHVGEFNPLSVRPVETPPPADLLARLGAGEHLVAPRGGLAGGAHHGICTGNGKVWHLQPDLRGGRRCLRAIAAPLRLVEVPIGEFGEGRPGPLLLVDYRGAAAFGLTRARPAEVLAAVKELAAAAAVDSEFENPEHFGFWCVTGRPGSAEAEKVLCRAATMVADSAVGMVGILPNMLAGWTQERMAPPGPLAAASTLTARAAGAANMDEEEPAAAWPLMLVEAMEVPPDPASFSTPVKQPPQLMGKSPGLWSPADSKPSPTEVPDLEEWCTIGAVGPAPAPKVRASAAALIGLSEEPGVLPATATLEPLNPDAEYPDSQLRSRLANRSGNGLDLLRLVFKAGGLRAAIEPLIAPGTTSEWETCTSKGHGRGNLGLCVYGNTEVEVLLVWVVPRADGAGSWLAAALQPSGGFSSLTDTELMHVAKQQSIATFGGAVHVPPGSVASAGLGLFRVYFWLSVPSAAALAEGAPLLGDFALVRIGLLLGPERAIVTACQHPEQHTPAGSKNCGEDDVFGSEFFSNNLIERSHAAVLSKRGSSSSSSSSSSSGGGGGGGGSGSGSNANKSDGSGSISSSDGESGDDSDEEGTHTWDTLDEDEQAAAQTLGWDAESWGDHTPKTRLTWSRLSNGDQLAAAALGYDGQSWDEYAIEATEGGPVLQMASLGTVSIGSPLMASLRPQKPPRMASEGTAGRDLIPETAAASPSAAEEANASRARQVLRAQILGQPDEWIPIARLTRPQAVTVAQARQAALTLRQTLSTTSSEPPPPPPPLETEAETEDKAAAAAAAAFAAVRQTLSKTPGEKPPIAPALTTDVPAAVGEAVQQNAPFPKPVQEPAPVLPAQVLEPELAEAPSAFALKIKPVWQLALPLLDVAALKFILQMVALELLGRTDDVDSAALLRATAALPADAREQFLESCTVLLKKVGKKGATEEVLRSNLGPAGFKAQHIEAVVETVAWVQGGASDVPPPWPASGASGGSEEAVPMEAVPMVAAPPSAHVAPRLPPPPRRLGMDMDV